jgi:signal peptidase I
MVQRVGAEYRAMTPRHRMHRLVRAAALAATLGLTGCSGSSSVPTTAPFQATLSGYYKGLAKHDAAQVCAQITPAFWQAMAGEINAYLASSGGTPLPGRSCLQGLHYLFGRLRAPTAPPRANLAVRNLAVHASTASAIVTNGSTRVPARFVRSSSGQWKLDCCTGAQLNHLPSTRYRVPSVSMEPTLKYGEIVTADNTVLRTRSPSLGEIVTVHPPAQTACADPRQGPGFPQLCGKPASGEGSDIVIKRVVGLPGDRIALVGGRLVRGGVLQHEPYIAPCKGSGAPCDFPKAIVVPPGAYFLLGDNRGNSLDSRFYGPVRRSWILGVVRH